MWLNLLLQLAAKYVFVRLLRGTEHLENKTMTHWATWFGVSIACGAAAFVIAEAVPFFGTLLGLLGAIAYAPMAVSLSSRCQDARQLMLQLVIPMHLWLYDFGHRRHEGPKGMMLFIFHCLMLVVGLFMTFGGGYAMIKTIFDQYASGLISSAFSCADK